MSHELTCRELVDFLDEYLSGGLLENTRAQFNAHLATCPSCVAYMKTYQASAQLVRTVLTRSEGPLPESVPEELIRAILAARGRP